MSGSGAADFSLTGRAGSILMFVVALFLRETPLKTTTKDMAEGTALEPEHSL